MQRKLSKFGEAYVSYGSYHNNRVNQLIHIICVPILTATFIAALSYIPLHYEFQGFTLGVDTLAVIVFLIIYLRLNVAFGLVMAVIFFIGIVAWKQIFAEIGKDLSFWKYLVGFHYATLAVQFVGHGVFQKRKPAMLDNFAESVSAPMFVLLEIGMMLGYKTSQMDYWIELVEKRVAQFREKSKIK